MDRQTITVDIAPEGYADHRLKVSQYDIGRPLGVYIKQDGADLDCSGYTAQLYLYKPDRTNIEKLCTIAGNLITWDTAEQETIVAGICVAEIRIRDGSQNVGTANFTIWVEESPADTSGSSHSESQSLIDMVDRAEDAAETAESSAAIAVHAKDETVAAAEAVERFDEMTAEAETLEPGSEATAEMDYTGEHPVMKFGIPAGATGPEGRQGQQGQQGEPGVSPVVSVSDITGGHRVTITDAEGTHTFDVMDGGKGDPGQTGPTGPAGYSPTVAVTDITGGHRVTITDQQGQHPFDVMNGEDSAVLSVNGETGAVVLDGTKVNVNNSAQTPVTVADELGNLNRALNDKLDSPQTAGTNGQVLTSDGQGGQSWQTPSGGGGISDVQVNGTSVVQDGVANVPIASSSSLGVVKVNDDGTYGVRYVPNTNTLGIKPAIASEVKSGTNGYKPIAPIIQDASTFYGLAKAAGDTSQASSSNAVGTYTDEAKQKIQQMLGVDRHMELIKSITVDEDIPSLTGIIIETDDLGNNFAINALNMFIECPAGAVSSINGAMVGLSGGVTKNGGFRFNQFGHTSYPMWHFCSCNLMNYGSCNLNITSFAYGTTSNYYSNFFYPSTDLLLCDSITKIEFKDNIIKAGTKIELWGHRV